MSNPAPSDVAIDAFDIVDEAHLNSFTNGDKTFEDELAELFVNTARGYVKRMKEAIAEERSWSAEAHALKGASANLGARRLAELARQAEFMPPSVEQVVALENAIDEVKTFFTKKEV